MIGRETKSTVSVLIITGLILIAVVAAVLPSCKKKRSAPNPTARPAAATTRAWLRPVKQAVAVVAPEPKRPSRQQVIKCVREFGEKVEVKDDPGVGLTWVMPAGGFWKLKMGELKSPKCLFIPYLGINSDGKYWTRLQTSYVSKRWLFVDHMIIMIDGKKEAISLDRYRDVDKDNTGSTVGETVDLKGHAELIHRVAEGLEVYVSLSGQHRRETWKLGEKQFEAFRTISDCLKAIDNWSETAGDTPKSPSDESTTSPSSIPH